MKLRFLGGRYDGASGVIPCAFPPLALWIHIGRCDREDCMRGLHASSEPMPDTEPYVLVDLDGTRAAYEHRNIEGPLTEEMANFLHEVGQ